MIESNPVLARYWRDDHVESIHRGAWVLVDSSGAILAGAGDPEQPIFGRSSTKSFQALPLIESGAADAFGLPVESIATAIASHSGEPQHDRVVSKTLELIGLDESVLQCGTQAPFASSHEDKATRVLHNCSGKHAGFLAVSQHLGADPADYLKPDGQVQTLVREAVIGITGADPATVSVAVDGCSAPTFRIPLRAMATGIARVANPDPEQLGTERADACERFVAAATEFPELVAGSVDRLCTDLLKVSKGRLFAKIGAEGVYFIGVVGADRGLALKIDDGGIRAFSPLLVRLLQQCDLISDNEVAELGKWASSTIQNWDGLVVGRVEMTDAVTSSSTVAG